MPTSLNKYLDPAALDETVVNIRQIVEDLEEEMQDLPYARPDGLYPDMTVGAVIGADDTAQWATRESTESGAATVRSVQGASVAWAQLIQLVDYYTTITGVTLTIDVETGHIALNGTAMSSGGRNNFVATNIPLTNGHKYLLRDTLNYAATGNTTVWSFSDVSGSHAFIITMPINQIYTYSGNDVTCWLGKPLTNGETYDCSGYVSMYDLTQMFGAGNEPTTVAEFEKMFPKAYYPYSAPTLKPVQIAGIQSTDAQGGELDAIEWTTQTLRAAGSVADMLYSDHVDVRVSVVDLGTLTWEYVADNAYFYAIVADKAKGFNNLRCAKYQTAAQAGVANLQNGQIVGGNNDSAIYIKDTAYTTTADFKVAMNGVLVFYELATPTTQPISPALPMTYRVQAGGNESIIVPSGEVSAAPVLTVAEPVNAGDEFARIWAAIQSLGYTRNTTQLSRPVSLTDIGSIDEVQKDTAEIDTTKEVTE